MAEIQCERDDCGRYFEVADPRKDSIRCPHCGYERSVPDDLESRAPTTSTTSAGSSEATEAAGTQVTAEGPVTIRITIEVLPGGGHADV